MQDSAIYRGYQAESGVQADAADQIDVGNRMRSN